MANMYKYYQRREDDAWKIVAVSELDRVVGEEQPKRVTILEVSEIVDGDRPRDSYYYKGPLYFDVDCKDDIPAAAASIKQLADKLHSLGVPMDALHLYASGSKGFHLTLAPRYFSSGRAVKALPLVYKEMALELFVTGMDLGVYSCGRGCSWRQVNVQRDDKRYRVPIYYNELDGITAESYAELCSKPRPELRAQLVPMHVAELSALFERGRKAVNARPKPVVIVTDNDLREIKTNPPACALAIADGKGLKPGKTFNESAMQLALYIVRAEVSDVTADGLINRAAEHLESSSYGTVRARRDHLQGQVAYMRSGSQYQFGCNMMRSLFINTPCRGCVIETAPESGNIGSSGGLIERVDGYYVVGKDSDRQLTNFTCEPTDVYMTIPQEGGRPRRVATGINIMRGGEQLDEILFDEPDWASRSAFVHATEGCSNFYFKGSDSDVQTLKQHILGQADDLGEVYQVYTCGLHLDYESHTQVLTYVEPGMSLNSNRVQGTHRLLGLAVTPPYLSKAAVCAKEDVDADDVLFHLLQINDPVKVGTMIGWFVACHLKVHLRYLYQQFPLLLVWGSAGSGKSASVGLMAWLNGLDLTGKDSAPNVASITEYAIVEYLASSTTVPRVLEEYNRSKMTKSTYNKVGEVLKAAWREESKLKGGLSTKENRGRSGGQVNVIPITGPAAVLREQDFDMPALQERSLRVQLSKASFAGRQVHMQAASNSKLKLREVARALMVKALVTKMGKVERMMEDYLAGLPKHMDERPRYSVAVALAGLEFLQELLEDDLLLPRSAAVCREVLAATQSHYENAEVRTEEMEVQSEADQVLQEMSYMAGRIQADDHYIQGIQAGVHYDCSPDWVYMDCAMMVSAYRQHMKINGMTPVIESPPMFRKLLQSQSYWEARKTIPRMAHEREVEVLNRKKLEEKGIDTSLFKV